MKSTTLRIKRLIAVCFICLTFIGSVQADWLEKQKLLASDGAAYDKFGWSVSLSGDYAIVGAIGGEYGKGAAYLFKRDGESWIQQVKLFASDGYYLDNFGRSVSISGDYVIVGAEGYDNSKGSTYIFKRDVASWVQQAKLLASDGYSADRFGWSVSIIGDYAIVGALNNGDNYEGSAYIFKRDGESWIEQQKLIASDGAESDNFGNSVSISDDYAIVGAFYDDYKGSAYIFKRDGENWIEKQKILASDGIYEDRFGQSVSISNNYAIVGAEQSYNGGPGSAYVFKRCPTADLWGDDCFVNFMDFAIIGSQWLQTPGEPSADIAPQGGDGAVNFLDLNILVDEWLQGGE
jgi:hypothetical protein